MATSRLPIEKFLPAYLKAAEEGVTKEEFARKMGLKPATVYQRVYELRREGYDIPLLTCEGRQSRSDKVAKIMAEFGKKSTASPPKKKAGPKTERLVKEAGENTVLEQSENELAEIFGAE
jgi:biotin operon repressor